jgi:hypothetical protein
VTTTSRSLARAFAWEHHPDRGGDPEVFALGWARLQAGHDPFTGRPLSSGGVVIAVHRRRSIPVDLLLTLLGRWRRRAAPRVQ